MDQQRLRALTRTLNGVPSRRDVLRGLAGTGLGLSLARLPVLVAASTRNQYGCLNVGDRCRRASQCCSGICTRENGKKKCRAHHRSGCAETADSCRKPVSCATSGLCVRTTGKASFCGISGGVCSGCTRDVECEPSYGPGAACVVCAECTNTDGRPATICFSAAT
jgi:hypothetical protein